MLYELTDVLLKVESGTNTIGHFVFIIPDIVESGIKHQ